MYLTYLSCLYEIYIYLYFSRFDIFEMTEKGFKKQTREMYVWPSNMIAQKLLFSRYDDFVI